MITDLPSCYRDQWTQEQHPMTCNIVIPMVYAETPVTSDAQLAATMIQSVTPAVKTWRENTLCITFLST